MTLPRRTRIRQQRRKWARRDESSRLRHLFMASVAINFRAAIMEWVANEIAAEEKRILYGAGVGIPMGIINWEEGR